MTTEDDDKKLNLTEEDEQGGEDTGGQAGGASGKINFRYKDAMSVGPRDDELSPTERKRLLAIHEGLHKEYVNKQKQTRKERKAIKEGFIQTRRRSNAIYSRAGYGAGIPSSYKQHPISRKAQFSGMDRQIIGLPSENQARTNEDKVNDLVNRLRHRNALRLVNAPRFNPRPRPR